MGTPLAGNDDNTATEEKAAGAADETEASRHLFSLGESDDGAAPLAAVFKTRRKRKRRKKSEVADPRAEPGAENTAPPPDHFRTEPPAAEASAPPAEEPSPPSEEPPPAAATLEPPETPVSAPTIEEAGETVEQDSVPPPPPAGARTLADIVPPGADPVWARDAVLSLASEYLEAHRTPTEGAWFSELFGKEYLAAQPLREGQQTEREVDFIERALNVAEGARVFDLCCGYGRHAISLARRGYDVVGLDLSMHLLQHALNRAQGESLSIKFVHGDMRDINFEEVFDGAFTADTSFGVFDDVENLSVLRGVHRALKRGGRFMLDVLNRDFAIKEVPSRNWWEGDGCLVQEDIEFDHRRSRLEIKRYLVFADGMERVYDISLRLFSLHELLRMLEVVGFEVVQVSGSLHTEGVYFGTRSRRLIVTAEKP